MAEAMKWTLITESYFFYSPIIKILANFQYFDHDCMGIRLHRIHLYNYIVSSLDMTLVSNVPPSTPTFSGMFTENDVTEKLA